MPDVLPDSRLSSDIGAVMCDWPLMDGSVVRVECVPVFCANCGTPYGFVPKDNTTFAFWLCQKCFDTYGEIAGTMVVGDELFRQKLHEEMLDQYGRDLTSVELLVLAEHGRLGSALEKLCRESPYNKLPFQG